MPRSAKNTKPCLRGFLQDTDGGSAIMLAVGLSVVFGAAALAVDYARAVTSRQLLASAADVAVLAAVSGLPNEATARQIALDYVEKNLPTDKFGKALAANDVELGGKGGASIDIMRSNRRNFLPSPYSRGIVLMQ